MTEQKQDALTESPDPGSGWDEGRHSESEQPHEEQEPGSLEEPETEPGPHQGEEGQRDEVA